MAPTRYTDMENYMLQNLVPKGMEEETTRHIRKIQSEMEDGSVLLVSSNVNIYYSTGRIFRGYVWLPKEGEPLYFVVKPQVFNHDERMVYIRKPEQIPDLLREREIEVPEKVGLETDVLTYNEAVRLIKLFPDSRILNGTTSLRNARMVKTPYEISQMRADGIKQSAVYSTISSLYTPGMTDIQLQIAIEGQLRKAGCLGFARVAGSLMEINMGSVLAGANADNPSPYEFAMGGAGADTSLPGGADGTLIRAGETVMIDMNGAFNAYQTDMTRIWTLGDLPRIAYDAHQCSIDILRELEKLAVPGVEVCELYFKAVEMAEKAGFADFFMGHNQKSGFIGHGVGIELNEQPPVAPRCKTVLKEGMTLALEPKFVIPAVGAVGVENTYAVRDTGLENLTVLTEEINKFG